MSFSSCNVFRVFNRYQYCWQWQSFDRGLAHHFDCDVGKPCRTGLINSGMGSEKVTYVGINLAIQFGELMLQYDATSEDRGGVPLTFCSATFNFGLNTWSVACYF